MAAKAGPARRCGACSGARSKVANKRACTCARVLCPCAAVLVCTHEVSTSRVHVHMFQVYTRTCLDCNAMLWRSLARSRILCIYAYHTLPLHASISTKLPIAISAAAAASRERRQGLHAQPNGRLRHACVADESTVSGHIPQHPHDVWQLRPREARRPVHRRECDKVLAALPLQDDESAAIPDATCAVWCEPAIRPGRLGTVHVHKQDVERKSSVDRTASAGVRVDERDERDEPTPHARAGPASAGSPAQHRLCERVSPQAKVRAHVCPAVARVRLQRSNVRDNSLDHTALR